MYHILCNVCYEQTVNKILKIIINYNFIKIFCSRPSEIFLRKTRINDRYFIHGSRNLSAFARSAEACKGSVKGPKKIRKFIM